MPNWSYNTLTIQGKKSDVVAMFSRATTVNEKRYNNEPEEVYTLQSFIPMPQTYKDVDTTNSLGCFLSEKKYEMKNTYPELSETKLDEKFNSVVQSLTEQYESARKYQQETYGIVGWRDWNLSNLGTKWDRIFITKKELDDILNACTDEDDDNGCIVECTFDTAWTPPIAWLEKVVAENPKLFFDMWSDEESGHKWWFEGSEGELSDDLSNGVRCDINNVLSEIDPNDWVVENEYDEKVSKVFVENFDEIVETFLNSGYWSRGGNWLEEFGDYYTDTWLSYNENLLDDETEE